MSIGVSILLFAVGAILRYAVDADWSDVNEQTIGLILMWVGGVGLAISLLFGLLVASTTRTAFKTFDHFGARDADNVARRYRRR